MPEYSWRAADATGRVSQGRLEAASSNAATRQLRERGLVPVSISDAALPAQNALARPSGGGVLSRYRVGRKSGPVTQAELLTLTTELSIMLRAGLPLASALRVLIDMSLRPPVSSVLHEVLEEVKRGSTLSRALGREQALFGDFYLNMVRSGETSGQLSSVLERL